MANFLINGLSGTGKTSISVELKKRGYKTIDTDDEFGYYADLQTEEPVEFPGKSVTAKWYKKNGWIWNRDKVKVALNYEGNIFFCGGSSNESIFYPNFSKIFCLVTDSNILIKRLKARSSEKHNNSIEFIQRIDEFLESSKQDAASLGWILIDTTKDSVSQSTDLILSYVEPI